MSRTAIDPARYSEGHIYMRNGSFKDFVRVDSIRKISLEISICEVDADGRVEVRPSHFRGIDRLPRDYRPLDDPLSSQRIMELAQEVQRQDVAWEKIDAYSSRFGSPTPMRVAGSDRIIMSAEELVDMLAGALR